MWKISWRQCKHIINFKVHQNNNQFYNKLLIQRHQNAAVRVIALNILMWYWPERVKAPVYILEWENEGLMGHHQHESQHEHRYKLYCWFKCQGVTITIYDMIIFKLNSPICCQRTDCSDFIIILIWVSALYDRSCNTSCYWMVYLTNRDSMPKHIWKRMVSKPDEYRTSFVWWEFQ